MKSKNIQKDLKSMGLIPRTRAFEQQMILTKYMYVFMTGIIIGTFIL